MEILNRLLEISIYSIILFLAIMVTKKICKNKMSPALHFMIWFILIARLCIPVTIDSGLNLIVIPDPALTEITQTAPAAIQDTTLSFSPEANIQSIPQMPISDGTLPAADNKTSSLLQQITSMKWIDIFLAVWLMGVFLRVVWMIAAALKMNRIISRLGIRPTLRIHELSEKCKIELDIKKDIPFYLLSSITTPALTIGLKPKMVLPSGITTTMNEERLAFTIKHEMMHYKRKDNFVSLILRILEAVYWFNPVVWLMSRLMIADMETACDSMVVKALDKQGRKQYVLTLLDMFSQKKAPKFMLGMALNNIEKIAEKRIRGVYMKDRSKRSVKIIAGILSAVLFVACFTTACQPTPDKPAVIGKNNDFEQKLMQSAASYSLAPSTETIPSERWQDSIDFDSSGVGIIIDAKIEIPAVASYPVFRVVPHVFSQEEAQRFVDAFMEGQPIYEYDSTQTKADIEQSIIRIQAMIEDVRNDTSLSETQRQSAIGTYTNELNQLMEEYNNAPVENEKTQGSVQFKEYNQSGSDSYRAIQLEADLGKTDPAILRIRLSEDNYENVVVFKNQDANTMYISNFDATDTLAGLNTTRQEAQTKAEELLNELGISNMQVFAANASMDVKNLDKTEYLTALSDPNRKKCYVFTFCRVIDGIPVTNLQPCYGIQSDGNSNFDKAWKQEELRITVDDSGVIGFYWGYPGDISESLNPNIQMINLDEIKDIFKQQICYQRIWSVPDVTDSLITINTMKFSFMRIKVKDENSYMILPVWDFIGDWTSTVNNVQCTTTNVSFLTVNAVDGSVIDRVKGY